MLIEATIQRGDQLERLAFIFPRASSASGMGRAAGDQGLDHVRVDSVSRVEATRDFDQRVLEQLFQRCQ